MKHILLYRPPNDFAERYVNTSNKSEPDVKFYGITSNVNNINKFNADSQSINSYTNIDLTSKFENIYENIITDENKGINSSLEAVIFLSKVDMAELTLEESTTCQVLSIINKVGDKAKKITIYYTFNLLSTDNKTNEIQLLTKTLNLCCSIYEFKLEIIHLGCILPHENTISSITFERDYLHTLISNIANLIIENKTRAPNFFSHYPLSLPDTLSTTSDGIMICDSQSIIDNIIGKVNNSDLNQVTHQRNQSIISIKTIIELICIHVDIPLSSHIQNANTCLEKRIRHELSEASEQDATYRNCINLPQINNYSQKNPTNEPILKALNNYIQLIINDIVQHRRPTNFESIQMLEKKSDNGLNYIRVGSGTEVFVIVNAFGLSLDFWTDLVKSLNMQCTFLILNTDERQENTDRINNSYYMGEQYRETFVQQTLKMISLENINDCHLISWCSGAKLALEFAHAQPDHVKSLLLITPSLVEANITEDDSAFEKSLVKLCEVVTRLPSTSGNMAKSMISLMEKNIQDYSKFKLEVTPSIAIESQVDKAYSPLISQPFNSSENLIEYSEQLINFRQHSIRDIVRDVTAKTLLITCTHDTTTSSSRAKTILKAMDNITGIEINYGSHYVLNQESDLLTLIIQKFLTDDLQNHSFNNRICTTFENKKLEMIEGEI